MNKCPRSEGLRGHTGTPFAVTWILQIWEAQNLTGLTETEPVDLSSVTYVPASSSPSPALSIIRGWTALHAKMKRKILWRRDRGQRRSLNAWHFWGKHNGLHKANCRWEGERGRPGYMNTGTTLVTKDGLHQVKEDSPVNTTASCRVEIHLHFLISYLVKKVKTDRSDASTWLIFPLDFLCNCTLGAEKETAKWAHLCLWTLHPVLPHVLHGKAYRGLV